MGAEDQRSRSSCRRRPPKPEPPPLLRGWPHLTARPLFRLSLPPLTGANQRTAESKAASSVAGRNRDQLPGRRRTGAAAPPPARRRALRRLTIAPAVLAVRPNPCSASVQLRFGHLRSTVRPPPATVRRHFDPSESPRPPPALASSNQPRIRPFQQRSEKSENGFPALFKVVLGRFPAPNSRPALGTIVPRVAAVGLIRFARDLDPVEELRRNLRRRTRK
ncbi:serine/arginine repetitive matrix protein 1-like [Eucalyptus grandis]|uniref:serine/arginine repetitive matrix protein 1-like n=1 Tax=Eucalyptus grandis TaxID=71139 RepID=UPI00192ECBDD|nr:serine/arginine repetitive matrix protein 1-like [Eucalyptus grandis]